MLGMMADNRPVPPVPSSKPWVGAPYTPAAEQNIRLRLALTQARDALERHRDPLVPVLDRVLGE